MTSPGSAAAMASATLRVFPLWEKYVTCSSSWSSGCGTLWTTVEGWPERPARCAPWEKSPWTSLRCVRRSSVMPCSRLQKAKAVPAASRPGGRAMRPRCRRRPDGDDEAEGHAMARTRSRSDSRLVLKQEHEVFGMLDGELQIGGSHVDEPGHVGRVGWLRECGAEAPPGLAEERGDEVHAAVEVAIESSRCEVGAASHLAQRQGVHGGALEKDRRWRRRGCAAAPRAGVAVAGTHRSTLASFSPCTAAPRSSPFVNNCSYSKRMFTNSQGRSRTRRGAPRLRRPSSFRRRGCRAGVAGLTAVRWATPSPP